MDQQDNFEQGNNPVANLILDLQGGIFLHSLVETFLLPRRQSEGEVAVKGLREAEAERGPAAAAQEEEGGQPQPQHVRGSLSR